MARPAKSMSVSSGKISKEEKEIRSGAEALIKGEGNVKPMDHLNANQRKIFENIKKMLKQSDILGSIDMYVLSNCAVAIDRIASIERMINEDPSLLTDDKLMSTKKKYTDEFFRCCNELCMSPQSRAKIASATVAVAKEQSDPLLAALGIK